MSEESRPLAESGPPLPHASAKTVVIPVRIIDGVVRSISGGELLKMTDCVGELTVRAASICNQADLAAFTAEESIPLLPAGTKLLCRLGARHVQLELKRDCIEEPLPEPSYRNGLFIEILLEEDLGIRFRSSKSATLNGAACSVPKMPSTKVGSVNEAYRRISERFEPSRRSVGGNVFSNVYVKPSPNARVVPLGQLRDERVAVWEAYLRTVFTAIDGDKKIEIRPGYQLEALDQLLRDHHASEWAYVTAFNPGSRVAPDELNRARHQELCAAVTSLGVPFLEGHGAGIDGDWPLEISLVVVGIALQDARALGRTFGQLAIVAGRVGEPARLVPCLRALSLGDRQVAELMSGCSPDPATSQQ
jgi:hypothetical protein